MPFCLTTSLQSWRQRKLNSSSFYTTTVTIAAVTALTVFTVIVNIFHFAVVETVTPELIRFTTSECDKAVVGQLPLHLEIKSNRRGDNGAELLFAIAQ